MNTKHNTLSLPKCYMLEIIATWKFP